MATMEQSGPVILHVSNAQTACKYNCQKAIQPTKFPSSHGPPLLMQLAGDSEKLITASADSSVKLWDVASGKDLFTFKSQEPCRAVAFSIGDRMAAYTTDQFMGQPSQIHLVNIADDLSEQNGDVIKSLSGPKGRITRIAWTDLNRTLISAGEDGFVRRWDVEVCSYICTLYSSTQYWPAQLCQHLSC